MLDYDLLRKELQNLKRHQKLYKILKEELTKLGYWKVKARGDPSKGYQIMKEKHETNL